MKGKITRREFLGSVSLAALSAIQPQNLLTQDVSSSLNASSNEAKPNVIWIMADDLGYGDIGAYGQQVIQTPNLDKLATEGMRFTQCYAASTVCAPSRWCLMTGMHTGHAHTPTNYGLLHSEDGTVAEIFKTAGYKTGVIGKWAMGDPGTSGLPYNKGFDFWYGYLNQNHAHNYYPQFLWENDKMKWFPENWECCKTYYSSDLFLNKTLEFLEANQDNPFFLYLSCTLPHANNELGAITGNGMQVPDDAPYSNETWPQTEKNFAAMVTRLDRDIGTILQKISDLGLDENTIIFFTSDNGPHNAGGHQVDFFNSAGPLRGWKRSLYEGGIRVPMLVRWSGTISPGVTNDDVWAFWDFFATIADIVQIDVETDGISILPTLLGLPQEPHDYYYWAFLEGRIYTQAVRFGNWKGVRPDTDSEIELYNIETDIGEQINVADQYPEIVETISEIMLEFDPTNKRLYLPVVSR